VQRHAAAAALQARIIDGTTSGAVNSRQQQVCSYSQSLLQAIELASAVIVAVGETSIHVLIVGKAGGMRQSITLSLSSKSSQMLWLGGFRRTLAHENVFSEPGTGEIFIVCHTQQSVEPPIVVLVPEKACILPALRKAAAARGLEEVCPRLLQFEKNVTLSYAVNSPRDSHGVSSRAASQPGELR
jgi:hypothetical protein